MTRDGVTVKRFYGATCVTCDFQADAPVVAGPVIHQWGCEEDGARLNKWRRWDSVTVRRLDGARCEPSAGPGFSGATWAAVWEGPEVRRCDVRDLPTRDLRSARGHANTQRLA